MWGRRGILSWFVERNAQVTSESRHSYIRICLQRTDRPRGGDDIQKKAHKHSFTHAHKPTQKKMKWSTLVVVVRVQQR